MKCEYINTVNVRKRKKKKVKMTLSLAVLLRQPQQLERALTGELVCDSTPPLRVAGSTPMLFGHSRAPD